MAGRIKGITIEIGGNTQPLQNALKDVNKQSDSLAKELKDVERLLKFDPGNVEALAQKQQLLTQQIENTTPGALGNRLVNAIRNGTATSRQLEQAIGIIGREALGAETDIEKLQRALRSVDAGNSIQQVRNELRDLQQEAGRTEKKFEGLKVGLENVIGGMAAGGGISTAIEKAMDMSKLKTKIDITFDVPESSKKSVEEAIRGVTAYGVDTEASLEGVRRQWALNKNVSDEANAAIAKGAAVISQAYEGIDYTELIQETYEIGNELGITQESALGMVDALLKMGFPPEQLDIIAEYGSQLTRAGFKAEEVNTTSN
ncbi:hypothetical protein M3Y14_30245 [Bacillus thuringiensis]|nr:hypothetical protein M3Y14_30245 [Bacillus thuringiensis]